MESYLIIKKQHSEKKNKDYVGSYLVFNGMEYMITLSNEVVSIVLDKTARQMVELPVGFVSPKFPINLDVE